LIRLSIRSIRSKYKLQITNYSCKKKQILCNPYANNHPLSLLGFPFFRIREGKSFSYPVNSKILADYFSRVIFMVWEKSPADTL